MNERGDSEITELLESVRSGRDGSKEELYRRVYGELKAMAGAQMVRERAGHTLQPTALVNEAFLRLTPSDGGDGQWQNRAHFFGSAARAMRRILVDSARRHQSSKRGGEAQRVTFADLAVGGPQPDLDLLALDGALTKLGQLDERKVRVVELRCFAGLTIDECARVLDVGRATVERDLKMARAWLVHHMGDGGRDAPSGP
ncbi:MAG: ECF-type sigma factor [Acidobacteriota bacterium]